MYATMAVAALLKRGGYSTTLTEGCTVVECEKFSVSVPHCAATGARFRDLESREYRARVLENGDEEFLVGSAAFVISREMMARRKTLERLREHCRGAYLKYLARVWTRAWTQVGERGGEPRHFRPRR